MKNGVPVRCYTNIRTVNGCTDGGERDVPEADTVERVVRRPRSIGEAHAAQVRHKYLRAVSGARHHHHWRLQFDLHAGMSTKKMIT